MTRLASPLSLPLPLFVRQHIDSGFHRLVHPPDEPVVDFNRPRGEAALVPPESLSWRIFKNPVALFVGGVAAVILELAEPAVRTGVWEHSSFRTDPVRRLQRTGNAAMVTVFAARSTAEAMIASIVRRHDRIAGETPDGEAYRANDVRVLCWVQATAAFGFATAYDRYVRPLARDELDSFYAEGVPAAHLYGALDAPASDAERQALFESMRLRLEPSPIVFEFLAIMRDAPAVPALLRPMQRRLVRAAVEITPQWARRRLGLTGAYGLRPGERLVVQQIASLSDKLMLHSSPAVQSCLRLGLPADYLYPG